MYPSIQAKIWGSLEEITGLPDVMLDSFIKTGTTGDLGSIKAEVTATTAALLEPFSFDFFDFSPPTPVDGS